MKRYSQRKIEKALKDMGRRAPSVDLAAIKAECGDKEETAKVLPTPRTYRAPRNRFATLAAVACLLLLVLLPVGGVKLNGAYTTALYIEAEDSVVLTVSPFGKVKGAVWKSSTGDTFVASAPQGSLLVLSCSAAEMTAFPVEVNGLDVEEAVDAVIDYMESSALLPEGCEVIISSVAGSEKRAERVAAKAQQAILNNRDTSLDATRVVVERAAGAVKGEESDVHSPAKEKYLNDLKDIPTSYTEEELKEFSTGYLRYLIRDHKAQKGEMPEEEKPTVENDRYYQDYADKVKPPFCGPEKPDGDEPHGRPERDD